MGRGWKVFLALVVALLAMLPILAVVLGQAQLPHAFWGTVTGNDAGATSFPAGTVITAEVDGVEWGSFTTTEAGVYGGGGGLDLKLIVQGDILPGSIIRFFVNGAEADQSFPFVIGRVTNLDLTAASTSPSGPPPTPPR